MNHRYWKDFWRQQSQSTINAPAQSQVLRTLNKQPLSSEMFAKILGAIKKELQLNPQDILLDLCCGNGVITIDLALSCKEVVGIDYTGDLLAQIDIKTHPNLSLRIEDVTEASLPEDRFTKVLMYAGIQYFSEREIVHLFSRVSQCLRAGGLFYVGDIPDADRIWQFFNLPEREKAYFDAVKDNRPIIGTWLHGPWLLKLGAYAGFTDCRIVAQSADLPYAHYRFDMVLRKI